MSDPVAILSGVEQLTDLDREILDFESGRWRYPGAKEQAIRENFGLSATRYYQRLLAISDMPAALAYDPVLVHRLQRRRRRDR